MSLPLLVESLLDADVGFLLRGEPLAQNDAPEGRARESGRPGWVQAFRLTR